MGTRSGDLDPSVVTYMMKKMKLNPYEMENVLNKQSGAYGISMVSVDFRDIENEAASGDKNAILALDVFHKVAAEYIIKCMVAMGGADVISFTAGVGEKGQDSRREICKYLKIFGVELNEEENQRLKGIEGKISSENSKVEVFVVPTNEELMIAKKTEELV